MGARREPFPPDDRLRGVRGRGDDVGAADGVLEGGGGGRAHLGGQLLRLGVVAACDPHLGSSRAPARTRGMRARLGAGAEDREHLRVVSRASSRAASAAAPAVRASVMYVPSISATGEPFSGSKSMIAAWCVGRSVLPGKSVTSLQPSPADGRYAGIAPSSPCSFAQAAIRGGIETAPGRELLVRPRERAFELLEVEELLDVRARENEHRKDVNRSRERRAASVCAKPLGAGVDHCAAHSEPAPPPGPAELAARAASSRRAPPRRGGRPWRRRSPRPSSWTGARARLRARRAGPRRSGGRLPRRERERDEPELHEQHVPVPRPPEVVHVRQAEHAQIRARREQQGDEHRRQAREAEERHAPKLRRRRPDDGDELHEPPDPERRRTQVHPVRELREPGVARVRRRVPRQREARREREPEHERRPEQRLPAGEPREIEQGGDEREAELHRDERDAEAGAPRRSATGRRRGTGRTEAAARPPHAGGTRRCRPRALPPRRCRSPSRSDARRVPTGARAARAAGSRGRRRRARARGSTPTERDARSASGPARRRPR